MLKIKINFNQNNKNREVSHLILHLISKKIPDGKQKALRFSIFCSLMKES